MATRYKDRITILEDAEIEELYGRPGSRTMSASTISPSRLRNARWPMATTAGLPARFQAPGAFAPWAEPVPARRAVSAPCAAAIEVVESVDAINEQTRQAGSM